MELGVPRAVVGKRLLCGRSLPEQQQVQMAVAWRVAEVFQLAVVSAPLVAMLVAS